MLWPVTQNWIPPLKIQSNFTDLQEKKITTAVSLRGFNFKLYDFSQMFFLRMGILELLGSSHSDLGLLEVPLQ